MGFTVDLRQTLQMRSAVKAQAAARGFLTRIRFLAKLEQRQSAAIRIQHAFRSVGKKRTFAKIVAHLWEELKTLTPTERKTRLDKIRVDLSNEVYRELLKRHVKKLLERHVSLRQVDDAVDKPIKKPRSGTMTEEDDENSDGVEEEEAIETKVAKEARLIRLITYLITYLLTYLITYLITWYDQARMRGITQGAEQRRRFWIDVFSRAYSNALHTHN